MKLTVIALLALLSFCSTSQAQCPRPVPAGMRHAHELQAQNEKGFPPEGAARSSANPATLQQEAAQLATLAATVPPAVRDASRGLLAKDLVEKLKEIEKLSKHLRSELKR